MLRVPMPVHFDLSARRITCCWALTWWERLRVLFTGRIWHRIVIRDTPLQPQLLSVYKPQLVIPGR